MMRVNELFYGADEREFMVTTSAQQIIRDPKLLVDSSPKPQDKPKPDPMKKGDEKTKPIVMDVSICCSSCVELLEPELTAIKGVKDVQCEIYKQRVTVTGTAAVAEVMAATRKHFKHAELSS